MNFNKAFEALQAGMPIKREEWQGYWVLEDGKVIIHLKEGTDLNILDTDDVMFTLSHMGEDDWEVASLSNCRRLREDREW